MLGLFVTRPAAELGLSAHCCEFSAQTALHAIVTFQQQFMNNPRAKRLAEGTAHFPP